MEYNNSEYDLENINFQNYEKMDLISLLSYELKKIDIKRIKNSINSIFYYLTEEQENSINNLCIDLYETKKSILYNLYNYLQNTNSYEIKKYNQNTILNELNNLYKFSRVKFKQFSDNITIYFENNFQKLIDFIQRGKIKYALEQINIIDKIKNEIKNSITDIESIQNYYLNNCSNFLNSKITVINNYNIPEKKNVNKNNHFKQIKIRNNLTPVYNRNSLFSSFDNLFKNHKNNSKNKIFNDNSNDNNNSYKINSKEEKNSLLKEYKNKVEEKVSEIEYLKDLLLKEKEYRNIILKELNNIKYLYSNNDFNNNLINLNFNNLISKLNKLTTMVINFAKELKKFNDSIDNDLFDDNEIKDNFQRLLNKLEEMIHLNLEGKKIEWKMIKENSLKVNILNDSFDNNLSDENNETIKINSYNKNNLKNEIYDNQNISFGSKNNFQSSNTNNLITIKSNNENMKKLLNENKNLKSQIASLLLSKESNNLINELNAKLQEENEKLNNELKEKEIIIDILKKPPQNFEETKIEDKEEKKNDMLDNNLNNEKIKYEKNLNNEDLKNENKSNLTKEDKNINNNIQSNINENNLNNEERKKFETEIDFLDNELNIIDNKKLVKNIFNNINQNNIEEIQLILEIENEKLKQENININKQLKDEIEKVYLLEMNYKKEINILNENIIQLKSNLEKINQENKVLNNKILNNKKQFQINNFNLKIEHNEDMDMIIKTESNLEKEEINLLKKKNLDLIEESKKLCDLIQEFKYNNNKGKEDLIVILRSAFEKFLSETKVDNKNKEYLNLILKLLEYSDEDINYIFSIIEGKKKNKVFSFFQG